MSPQNRRRIPVGVDACLEAEPAGGEGGMTLIEVMVALLVLAVALLAVASTVIASLTTLVDARHRQAAYTAATRSIEVARSYAWDELALRTGDATVPTDTLDPERGTIDAPGTGETILRNPAGRVTGAPHQLDEGDRRVRTYVTDYTDPGAPDAEQRRVTVIVEWRRGDRVSSLREQTIVSQARWGVAQPSFALSPVDGVLAVERSRRDCLTHTVTNRGSDDRYTVTPPTVPGGWDLATVYEDLDADAVPDPNEQLTAGERTGSYGFGASFDLLICYRAQAGATASIADASFVVESELEPDKTQQAANSVSLELERTAYLRSGGGTEGGMRSLGTPYETSVAPPTAATVPDVDANVDVRPGLLLPRDPAIAADHTATWRMPFDAPRHAQSAALRLYTSTPSALDGALEGTVQQTFRLELRRIDASGAVADTFGAAEAVVSHSADQPAWVPHTWSLPMTATQLAVGEQLELAVTCAPSSATDCLVAFDAAATPSALTVRFP